MVWLEHLHFGASIRTTALVDFHVKDGGVSTLRNFDLRLVNDPVFDLSRESKHHEALEGATTETLELLHHRAEHKMVI